MRVAQVQFLAAMKSDSRLHSDTVMETSCIDTSQQKLCSKDREQEGWLAAPCSLHFIIICIRRIQMGWFVILILQGQKS